VARPKKLNATKQGHRTKEELAEAELQENGLEQFEKLNIDSTPKELKGIAQKEWIRVVPLLEQLPIAELDYDRVKRYCQLVGITDEAYEHVSKYGTVNEEGTKKTPQFLVYLDGLRELKTICGQLGMTIDSRMRIVLPQENEKKQSVYDMFGVDDDD